MAVAHGSGAWQWRMELALELAQAGCSGSVTPTANDGRWLFRDGTRVAVSRPDLFGGMGGRNDRRPQR
jgi:hypothetical protein